MTARRVTIYRDSAGEWRYRVQANNWRITATAEEGFKQKRTILKRVERLWPDAELVEI